MNDSAIHAHLFSRFIPKFAWILFVPNHINHLMDYLRLDSMKLYIYRFIKYLSLNPGHNIINNNFTSIQMKNYLYKLHGSRLRISSLQFYARSCFNAVPDRLCQPYSFYVSMYIANTSWLVILKLES